MAPQSPGAPASGAPDPLSDVLRAVRLRGAIYFYVSCRDEWGAEAPPARAIADTVLPGAEHVLAYHMIVKGSGWAATGGVAPVRLATGDIVMFPRGDAHVMSSAPGMRADRVDTGFYFTPRPPQLPFALTVNGQGVTTARLDGGGRDQATVVCGFLGCDAKPFNPLLASLPRVLRMPGAAAGEASWIASFLLSAVDE